LILKTILYNFHKELDDIYGKHEVDSFFNILMEHYLNLKRIRLVLEPGFVVSKEQSQVLFDALHQLKLQRPIQYIIGETEFYGLPFKVNAHTLIPRPETEELVDWVIKSRLKSCTEGRRNASEVSQLRILDIGTGSGCIAIALAKHIPDAKVYALDVSSEALKIANQNAELNAVEVECIHGDILKGCPTDLISASPNFDIIISNPPYVRHLEKAEIQPNVLNNEPHLALFVDDGNPLQFYKAICEFAKTNLKENGLLYFEINEYLGEAMVDLLSDMGLKTITLKQDMFGKDRMIKGIRK